MQFKKSFLLLIVFIFLTAPAHAQTSHGSGYLTTQEIERLRAVKELLGGIDRKSLQETVSELKKSHHPEINVEMQEAMARTYMDLVRDFNIDGQKKKEWLYSMVCLNMAYLQFGGSPGKYGSTTELNRLIRQKLMKYLPADILKQPGFIYSLQ